MLKTLKQVDVKNKRVLVRVDFNIPLKEKEKLAKIESAIPTLKYLIKKKSKIILITHLGRPNGGLVDDLRLDFIAKEVGKFLKKKIQKLDGALGKKIQEAVKKMNPGDIVMLENIRFYPEEEKNSPKFAKQLAKLGDIFVNDAFAVSHRKHASTVGVAKYLPSAAGFLFQQEVRELNRVLCEPKHPLVVIIGGAKVSTKIKVIKKFLKKADRLLLGSALANTIFAARGLEIGKSFVEKEMFKVVEDLDLDNPKLLLPVDFVVLSELNSDRAEIRGINAVKENESVFDIGPRTIELFLESIKDAKIIVWNGPLGTIEKKPFDRGTEVVARAIVESKAYSIVGGGDIGAFVRRLGLGKKFSYVSTGGGAMLEYLANETLPGIEALKKLSR